MEQEAQLQAQQELAERAVQHTSRCEAEMAAAHIAVHADKAQQGLAGNVQQGSNDAARAKATKLQRKCVSASD